MKKHLFYNELSQYYDLVYGKKDYRKESSFVKLMADRFKTGNELLDVGCGTGRHDKYLKKFFKITGFDKSKPMLKIARKNNPGINYLHADMVNFDLGKSFDIIIALFGVIHYVKDYRQMRSVLKRFYDHLRPNGLLIFDAGLTVRNFKNRTEIIGSKKNDLNVTMIENVYRTGDYKADVSLMFLINDDNGFRKEFDEHEHLIIDVKKTKSLLEAFGFKVYLFNRDFSGKKYTKDSKAPVFVCFK